MIKKNTDNMKQIFINVREERKRLEDLFLQKKKYNEEKENQIENILKLLESSKSISLGQYHICLNTIIMYQIPKTDEYMDRLLKVVNKIK